MLHFVGPDPLDEQDVYVAFNPSVPANARVHDYWLGGKVNFAADRALAEKFIEAEA
jgi:hypothetical protein